MKGYQVDIRITPWEDGGYLVEVPALQGCWCTIKPRQTVATAIDDIVELVQLMIAARKDMGDPIPPQMKLVECDESEPLVVMATITVPATENVGAPKVP